MCVCVSVCVCKFSRMNTCDQPAIFVYTREYSTMDSSRPRQSSISPPECARGGSPAGRSLANTGAGLRLQLGMGIICLAPHRTFRFKVNLNPRHAGSQPTGATCREGAWATEGCCYKVLAVEYCYGSGPVKTWLMSLLYSQPGEPPMYACFLAGARGRRRR